VRAPVHGDQGFRLEGQVAIEAILRRLDGCGIPDYAAETMLAQTRQNAQQWREDPVAAAEIEGRLL
jgi:hypothetical protein